MNLKEKIKREFPREWDELQKAENSLDRDANVTGLSFLDGNITPATFQRITRAKADILDRLLGEEK